MTTHAVERRHPPDALMRLVNPIIRRVVARGGAANQLLLLHYAGRRTGTRYDVPVGYHEIDDEILLLTNSGWRHNFAGGADIEVTFRGKRRRARAELVDDIDVVTDLYHSQIQEMGVKAAQRRLGIKVNVDRQPTREEIAEAVSRSGLSIVRLTLE
ncbi:MAG: nitroreductase/quinone reductase family protein [bacterium]